MNNLSVFIISDSVGETGDLVTKAAISQFRPGMQDTKLQRFPHVESVEQLTEIVHLAKEQNAIIVFTLVKEIMRDFLHDICQENGNSSCRFNGANNGNAWRNSTS